MDSFIERFCAKYYFPYAEGRQLIEGMEYKTYRKGDCLVREGERDTSFYIIARGIWRGHYLRDGQEVSVWFASEGEALFSTWGYVDNVWGIERSGFFNGREKWVKGFENQMV